jgi:hypothetical protein
MKQIKFRDIRNIVICGGIHFDEMLEILFVLIVAVVSLLMNT